MIGNKRDIEELKQELDQLNAEQHEDLANAVYLGMPPEKVKRMDLRCARIKQICEELCGFEVTAIFSEKM